MAFWLRRPFRAFIMVVLTQGSAAEQPSPWAVLRRAFSAGLTHIPSGAGILTRTSDCTRFGSLSVSAFAQYGTADNDCDTDTDSEWFSRRFIFGTGS